MFLSWFWIGHREIFISIKNQKAEMNEIWKLHEGKRASPGTRHNRENSSSLRCEQKPNFIQKSVNVSPVLSVITVPQSAERWHSSQLKASSARWLQVCTCSNPLWWQTQFNPCPRASSIFWACFQASWNSSVDFIKWQKPQNCARSIPKDPFNILEHVCCHFSGVLLITVWGNLWYYCSWWYK